MGMIGFLVQGRVWIRVRVRVRVYVSFNISISCRSICRLSICHGTGEKLGTINLSPISECTKLLNILRLYQ